MATLTSDKPSCIGFFFTAAQADRAAAPVTCRRLFPGAARGGMSGAVQGSVRAERAAGRTAGAHGVGAIVEGGAVGAAVGGIALAATVIASGGLGLAAIPVLVGGGAIAGAFSNLIVSDGYGKGMGEYFEEAVHRGQIVIGVEVEGEHAAQRFTEAQHILAEEGATLPTDQRTPSK